MAEDKKTSDSSLSPNFGRDGLGHIPELPIEDRYDIHHEGARGGMQS